MKELSNQVSGQVVQKQLDMSRKWKEKADLYKGGLCGDELSLALSGRKCCLMAKVCASIKACGEITVGKTRQH